MSVRKKMMFLGYFLIATQLANFLDSARAQSCSQIKLDADRIPWVQLVYGIRNFSVEVDTQVQLESLPAAEVEAALIESPQGVPLEVASPQSYKITVKNVVDPIFKPPVETINQVWFSPQDATALGRFRLRRGQDGFKKVYRFTKQGVFRHRREPKDPQEILKEPEKWTDVKDTFYAYDLTKLGCPNVSDRLLLIYIASAADIQENDRPISLCVFGKRKLFQVQLKPSEIRSIKADFIENKQGKETRRQEKMRGLIIELEVSSLRSDQGIEENFSLLGLHKNIAFHIDPETKLLLQISGETSAGRKGILKLKEVYYK
jgi:hypothetical protein